jgi:hypothetical protein
VLTSAWAQRCCAPGAAAGPSLNGFWSWLWEKARAGSHSLGVDFAAGLSSAFLKESSVEGQEGAVRGRRMRATQAGSGRVVGFGSLHVERRFHW